MYVYERSSRWKVRRMEDESGEDESRYDDVCNGRRVEEIFPAGDRDGNYQNAFSRDCRKTSRIIEVA